MKYIDDKGRIFGRVNVIDVLVVLFALAIVVTGAALVFAPTDEGEGEDERQPSYAIVDLGTPPEGVISEMETATPSDFKDRPDGTVNVTDIESVLTVSGSTRIVARVKLPSANDERTLPNGNTPLRAGQSVNITSDRYIVAGTVMGFDQSPTFTRERVDILVRDTIDTESAESINSGTNVRIGSNGMATVKSINRYSTETPDKMRVFVGLEIETAHLNSTQQYGKTAVKHGTPIRFSTETYRVNGTAEAVGTLRKPGEYRTQTVTLRLDDVESRTVDRLQSGMVETSATDTIARITDIDVESSEMIVTTDDGEVKTRDHPLNRDVIIKAELAVREAEGNIWFKGERLRVNEQIVFDTGETTFIPVVDSIE